MIVYMADGAVEFTPDQGKPHKDAVKEGQTVYQSAQAGMMKNAGSSALHFARIEFLTAGSPATWGMKGLSPNYVMLLEDRHAARMTSRFPRAHLNRNTLTMIGSWSRFPARNWNTFCRMARSSRQR